MVHLGFTLLAWGGLFVVLLMMLAWLLYRRTDNAGWVDVAWAYGLGGLAILFAALGPGDPVRRGLVAILGGGWSVRLGTYLLLRLLHDPHEDGRYTALRKEWGGNLSLRFFGFFQFQALLDLVLAWPFLVVSLDPSRGIHPLAWVGVALWLVSLAGEALADLQLRRFKCSPLHRGRVCRSGLWAWSRHPNYFFEWLVWVAFALLATASPWGWTAWACPLLMLYFLLRVTGIPATEAQSVRSKGEEYLRYQAEVSAFVPWPTREGR
jgi:steroid 5-alpha reductase family enzyme